jgi:hypothetical protein
MQRIFKVRRTATLIRRLPQGQSAADKPVYEIVLKPEDGLYPLPYMARQANLRAWEEECAEPGAPATRARQGFYPDGARVFEEIDRFGVSEKGWGNLISARADIDFYRVLPPAGYTKGLAQLERTDIGAGDIAPEQRGRDFFHTSPTRRRTSRDRDWHACNAVQRGREREILGGIWDRGPIETI